MPDVKHPARPVDNEDMFRAGIVAPIVAVALVAAAGAQAALTPSQYRAQTTAICARTKTRVAALEPTPTISVTRAQGATILAERLVVTRNEYMAFRALKPPASLATMHSKILWDLWKTYNADAKLVQQMRGSAGDPYTLASSELKSTSSYWFDLADQWDALGNKNCADADSLALAWVHS